VKNIIARKRGYLEQILQKYFFQDTFGSCGNDSDSSEDLHYGPGFVSRLKSKYMSVALRGSSGTYGGKTPGNKIITNLRRTASLEDFLEQV